MAVVSFPSAKGSMTRSSFSMIARVGMATLLATAPSVVHAQLTGYDNRAAFLSGITGSTSVETFESFAAGTLITNQLAGVGSVSGVNRFGSATGVFVSSSASMPFPMFTSGTPLPSGTKFLSVNMANPSFATGSILLTMLEGSTAIGAFVADGAPLSGFSIELFNGSASLGTVSVGPRTLPNSFVGVTSVATFTSARFFGVNSNDSWGLDNLEFNTASVVPEPSSWALSAAGLLAIAAMSARRRKSA